MTPRLLVPCLLVAALPVQAQNVQITLHPDAQQVAGRLMIDTAALEALVTEQLRALYSLADAETFLRLSANAQSMSSKGLGVEYAATLGTFVFGLGFNATAVAGDTDLAMLKDTLTGDFERAIPVAAGVQLSLMAGVQLAPNLYFFANGLAYPVSLDHFEGSGYNVGGHLQYRLGSGLGTKVLVEWGGVALTTGVEVSRTTYKLSDTLDMAVPLSGGIAMDTRSTGTVELVQSAITIPAEVTTSLRLFYFLTLFGGLGADLQLGEASATFNLDSTLSAEGTQLGTAHVDYTGKGQPSRLGWRGLLGLEANLGPLLAFVQANLQLQDVTLGVSAGVRVAY